MAKPLRVYLVDDSIVARLALEELLVAEGMVVVGRAASGAKAIREIPRLRPDVVLMDVLMPEMDGLECTRAIMAARATPILIVSDLVGVRARLNFEILEAGALDLCAKPTRREIEDGSAQRRLGRLVRLVAAVPVVTRRPAARTGKLAAAPRSRSKAPPVAARSSPPPSPSSSGGPAGTVGPAGTPEALLIGASTGGPPALREILGGLHACGELGPPIVIVQHMTRGFMAGLARWLSQAMGAEVELARAYTPLRRGAVILAPDDRSVERRGDQLILVDGPARGHRPSVDLLFDSFARHPEAARCCAFLLTGMGRDGARGMAALHGAGAWTVAQDEASCVVWGMPQAAVELGAAREVLPLTQIRARVHHWRAGGRGPITRS